MKTNLRAILVGLTLCACPSGLSYSAIAAGAQTNETAQNHMEAAQKAYSTKDYKLAIKEFNSAESLDKASAEPLIGLGRCYMATEEKKGAAKTLLKAIKIDSSLAEPHYLLAKVYFRMKEIAKSKDQ